MHRIIAIIIHACIAQALAKDSMDTLADKLVNKLIDRVSSAPIDLADLEQTTLAKTAPSSTILGKTAPLASYLPQLRTNAMASQSNFMRAQHPLTVAHGEAPDRAPPGRRPFMGARSPFLNNQPLMGAQLVQVPPDLFDEEEEEDEPEVEEKEPVSPEWLALMKDSGTPESQITFLTRKVVYLTEHLKEHKKDHAARRGLQGFLATRRKQLAYLKKKSQARYDAIVQKLGIRGLPRTVVKSGYSVTIDRSTVIRKKELAGKRVPR